MTSPDLSGWGRGGKAIKGGGFPFAHLRGKAGAGGAELALEMSQSSLLSAEVSEVAAGLLGFSRQGVGKCRGPGGGGRGKTSVPCLPR